MNSKPQQNSAIPSWDLTHIYQGIGDAQIINDQQAALAASEQFASTYSGKINDSVSPEYLNTALIEYERFFALAAKPAHYAQLVLAADSLNPKHGVLTQQAHDVYLRVRRNTIFFELALANLKLETLKKLAGDPVLKNYKHFIEEVVKNKPHQLSEEAEKIFNDKSVTAAAIVRLFEQNYSQKHFTAELDGQKQTLALDQILALGESPNREHRKAGADGLAAGLEQDLNMNALILNTLVKDKAIGDEYRKFKTPEQARHLANEVDEETAQALSDAVTGNYQIVQEFYKFKKEIMGLDQLHVYDRYAPISATTVKFSFDQAKQMVLEAFENFSPEFGRIAKGFFDQKKIDAAVREGKRAGAFCSYITPDVHPVVFLNYAAQPRDVKTLAHELGHGINGVLMQKQTIINYGAPLTLAETASVFAEFLLFEYMLSVTKDPKERFALYIDRIQNTFATVFRQISMHNFEQAVYNLHKTKGELTPKEISEIWDSNQKKMYGDSMVIEDKYSNLWSYIPHFIHSPFYVYAYAFGELLVLSLFAKYKEDKTNFVPKYTEFMSQGSNASPQELLQPFGIDLKDTAFWEKGIRLIEQMIVDAKAEYAKMAK